MEKSAAASKRQFSHRLLAFFITIFSAFLPLAAEVLNSRQIRDLVVQSQSDTVFTQKDCIFTLTIPGIRPENVRTAIPKLPGGVQFVSSRRSDFIDSDRDAGTQIEFWFSFSSSGTFTIPPLTAVINGRTYKLAFSAVSVYENPANITPKMIIKFTGGIKGAENDNTAVVNAGVSDSSAQGFYCAAGTKVYLTVYLKYAVQVMKFDWKLQKNALFSELERYEITKGQTRGSSFSAEEFPVARFEWVPLTAGKWLLPDIRITATAYNGSRVEIATPFCNIQVSDPEPRKPFQAQPAADDAVFAYAFTESAKAAGSRKVFTIEDADCKQLALLRSAERNSFPFSKQRKARLAYEKKLGIDTDVTEPSVPLFYCCIVLGAVCFILSVFSLVHKSRTAVLFLIAGAASLMFAAVYGIKIQTEYAVFAGGIISPIPENTAAASQNEAGGNRVKILEKTGSWRYIVYNDTSGWVSKDAVFIIK